MRSYRRLLLATGILLFLTMTSCRKKGEKYEGTYTGIERHTYRDSGATTYSLDTTYPLEILVTYTNALLPKKRYYRFDKNSPNSNIWTISRKSMVDGEYREVYSDGYLKFYGDSLYVYSSNFSDAQIDWDTETWEFWGKR